MFFCLTVFKPTYFPWCNGWQLGLDDKLLRVARSGEGEVAQEFEKLHKYVCFMMPLPQKTPSFYLFLFVPCNLKPLFLTYCRWIVANNSSGIITRQEVVSMVPVAVLDIQPSHRILDLCASPGSKTTQALEALYKTLQVLTVTVGNEE